MLCGAHHSAQSQILPVRSPPPAVRPATRSGVPHLHRSSSARRTPLALRPALDLHIFPPAATHAVILSPVRCEPTAAQKDVMASNHQRAGMGCSAGRGAGVMRLLPHFWFYRAVASLPQRASSAFSSRSRLLRHLPTPNPTYAPSPSSPPPRRRGRAMDPSPPR